jgi:hypothetical protein
MNLAASVDKGTQFPQRNKIFMPNRSLPAVYQSSGREDVDGTARIASGTLRPRHDHPMPVLKATPPPEYPTPDDTMANMSSVMSEIERMSLLEDLAGESAAVAVTETERRSNEVSIKKVDTVEVIDVEEDSENVRIISHSRPPTFPKNMSQVEHGQQHNGSVQGKMAKCLHGENMKTETHRAAIGGRPTVKRAFSEVISDPRLKQRVQLAKSYHQPSPRVYDPLEYSFDEENMENDPSNGLHNTNYTGKIPLNSTKFLKSELKRLKESTLDQGMAKEKANSIMNAARKQVANAVVNKPFGASIYGAPSKIPTYRDTRYGETNISSTTAPRAKISLSESWKKLRHLKPTQDLL